MVNISDNINIENLSVSFFKNKNWIKILDNINIEFVAKKVTVIIGESGCGKSILGQAILDILPRNAKKEGAVIVDKTIINDFGIIPQNPSGSLNPIRKISLQMQDILDTKNIVDKNNTYKEKCLNIFGLQDVKRVLQAYPYELSGGMLQRVVCAMAISTNPKWILADEPTKGLDEITSKLVLTNLTKLKKYMQGNMIIITHDINLVRYLGDVTVVMYAGEVLEVNNEFMENPLHPYSKNFLQALPENGLKPISGKPPSLEDYFEGCKFVDRCKFSKSKCYRQRPQLYDLGNGKSVRCFLYAESK